MSERRMIATLVVDDDARVAAVHREYLERLEGFVVAGVVHRATEALERVGAGGIDLVLLDLYLPDAHGLELCRVLRARSRRPVDVIVITAARDVETVRRAVSQGVVQYLIKPFSFDAFRDRLERYASYRAGVQRGGEELDQAQVDALLRPLRGGTGERPLPKGLSADTLDAVRRALGSDDRSAAEIAAGTGTSRVTARRYLEHLVEEGLAKRSLRYGTTGRPEHRYRRA